MAIKTSRVEEYSSIEADMRKRRLKFYGHIMRLPEYRITRKIVKYAASLINGREWIQNISNDLKLAQITEEEIYERNKSEGRLKNGRLNRKQEPQNPG